MPFLKNNLANWLNLARKINAAQEELAKFGYRSDSKVEYFQRLEVSRESKVFFFGNHALCSQPPPTNCLNLAISGIFFLEIWQLWVDSH
jgi:hypothetical protein